jgi:hypothetical protein
MSNKQAAFKAMSLFLNAKIDMQLAMHQAGFATADVQRPVVVEFVCTQFEGATPKEYRGELVLPTSHKNYEGMKTMVRDIMANLRGETRRSLAKSSPKKETIAAPTKTYDAVEKIILQSGMTKAEFNALIAQLKASVSFE